VTPEQYEALLNAIAERQARTAPPAGGAVGRVARDAANVAGQFGAGVNRGITGLAGALPDLYDRGIGALGMPRLFGNETQTATERLRGGLDSLIGAAPAPQGGVEQFARGAGEGVVDAASMAVPAAAVARTARAGSMAQGVGQALAAQPLVQGAAGAVGGGVAETTGSPLTGAMAALATPLGLAGARRVVTPMPVRNAERDALVRTLETEGVPVSAGQASGSGFVRNVEAAMEQLPLTSGPARQQALGTERAFTAAALRRTGETADNAGPQTLTAIRNRLGREFNEIGQRHDLQVTPALDQELAGIRTGLRFLPDDIRNAVRSRLDQIEEALVVPPQGSNAAPIVPGRAYLLLDSSMGRTQRQGGPLGAAVGDIRDRLRTAMDASIAQSANPEDAQRWAEARRQYANLMVVARAMSGSGASIAEGRLSPPTLLGAVRNSTSPQGVAFGAGDLNDLARAGQAVLRPVPDSGTAGRGAAISALTGGGLVGSLASGGDLGTTAATAAVAGLMPRAAQAVMNTGPAQTYLRNQRAAGPAFTPGSVAGMAGAQIGGQTDQGEQRRMSAMAPFLSPQQRRILGLN
jgi:hypothetical protein